MDAIKTTNSRAMLAMAAMVVAVFGLLALGSDSPAPRLLVLLAAAVPALYCVIARLQKDTRWLVLLLVLEETLPYVMLTPITPGMEPQPRWFLRYPLMLALCLPMLPIAFKSRILWQGNFRYYLAYYGWCALTVFYSLVPTVSAGRLLPTILLFCALSAMAAQVRGAEDVQRILGRFLFGCEILLALMAIGAALLPHDVNWTEDMGGMVRFTSIFGDPNAVGQLMIVTVGAGVAHWPFASKRERLGIAYALTTAIALAAMADSRSAFVAAGAGVISYVLWRYRARGALACLVLLLALGLAWTQLGSAVRDYATRNLATLTGRTEAWHFELKEVMRRPLAGYGYNVEGQIFKDRYFTNWGIFWDRGADVPLHNGYLSIAVGVGIPALIFWLYLTISPWRVIFRKRLDPWNLKPIGLLIVLPAMLRGLDESWIDAIRYPMGVLAVTCWMLAERERMEIVAADYRTRAESLRKLPPAVAALIGCIALGLAILIPARAAFATSFYVDSVGGLDSNSGTAPDQAWKTIERVNRSLLNPDDVVQFKRGGLWREMLKPRRGGKPGAPVIFKAYGNGPKPIISGADIVSGWTRVSGTIHSAPLASAPGNIYVDGGPGWGLRRACCLPDGFCTAGGACATGPMKPGTWLFDGSKLFVWLPDGSDPRSHRMEAAVRVSGFYANVADDEAANIVVDGLHFARTAGYGIYFHSYAGVAGLAGLVLENNTVTQTGTGPVDDDHYFNAIMILQEPTLPTAPLIMNNTIAYSGGHGNGINCQGASGARIIGNNVANWNHNGIDVKNSRNVLVADNTAHDQPELGAGFYCEYVTDSTWTGNTAYNVSNGFQISVNSSARLIRNAIRNAGTAVYFGPRANSLTAQYNSSSGSTQPVIDASQGRIIQNGNSWR